MDPERDHDTASMTESLGGIHQPPKQLSLQLISAVGLLLFNLQFAKGPNAVMFGAFLDSAVNDWGKEGRKHQCPRLCLFLGDGNRTSCSPS